MATTAESRTERIEAQLKGIPAKPGVYLYRGAKDAGGAIFAATNIALGACILIALIFEPRGLAHRWEVLKNGFQIWPFPHR